MKKIGIDLEKMCNNVRVWVDFDAAWIRRFPAALLTLFLHLKMEKASFPSRWNLASEIGIPTPPDTTFGGIISRAINPFRSSFLPDTISYFQRRSHTIRRTHTRVRNIMQIFRPIFRSKPPFFLEKHIWGYSFVYTFL